MKRKLSPGDPEEEEPAPSDRRGAGQGCGRTGDGLGVRMHGIGDGHGARRERGGSKRGAGFFLAALAVFLGVGLVIVDGTIVNVALPVMASGLGVGEGPATWLVVAYQMGLLALLFPAMSMATVLGARRMFLLGVCVFTVASLGCALSPSYAALLLFRVLQSVGGAAILSVNMALVEAVFQKEDLDHGMGMNTATISLSIILGPPIAALILSVLPWPWLFAFNVPLGCLVLWTGRKHLPATPRGTGPDSSDSPPPCSARHQLATLLFSIALTAGFFGVAGTLVYDLHSLLAPAGLVLIAVATGLYLNHQKKIGAHLLPRALFARRGFVLSVVCLFFAFLAQGGAVLAMPFLFMGRLGFDLAQTSLLLVCWPALHVVASLSSGHLTRRITPSLVCLCGLVLCAAGLAALSFSEPPAALAGTGALVALCGLGYGLFQAPNDTVGLRWSPASCRVQTSAVLAFTRTLGQTAGSLATAACLVHLPDNRTLPFALVAGFALVAAGLVLARYRLCGDPEREEQGA